MYSPIYIEFFLLLILYVPDLVFSFHSFLITLIIKKDYPYYSPLSASIYKKGKGALNRASVYFFFSLSFALFPFLISRRNNMQLAKVLVFSSALASIASAFESKRSNFEPFRLDKRQDCYEFPCGQGFEYCTEANCRAQGYDDKPIVQAPCINGVCYCGFSADF